MATSTPLTQAQIDEAHTWLNNEQSGGYDANGQWNPSLNPALVNGVYDTSNANRNAQVAGAGQAMGYTPDQMAQILGIPADQIGAWETTHQTDDGIYQDVFNADRANGIVTSNGDLNYDNAPGTPAPPAPTPAPVSTAPSPSSSSSSAYGSGGTQLDPSAVTAATASTVGTPTAWNVTDDQTVEGRINKIVNGVVGQQARAMSDGEMNERGLSNSSMATTGAIDAAYKAAQPIAQADAATFAKAAGYNADQINQANLENAQLGTQTSIANLNANTQWADANLSARTSLQTAQIGADTQKAIAQLNASTNMGIAQLDSATKLQVQQFANDNQVLLNTSSQAATAFNQYVVSATNIENNNNMDAATKNLALQTLWQDTQNQLTILANLNHLDLTSLLVNNVTVPTPAPTPAPAPEGGGIVTNANGY
jgi:DNA-binding transcriptional regulator YiaG